jgi:hypothetical protein
MSTSGSKTPAPARWQIAAAKDPGERNAGDVEALFQRVLGKRDRTPEDKQQRVELAVQYATAFGRFPPSLKMNQLLLLVENTYVPDQNKKLDDFFRLGKEVARRIVKAYYDARPKREIAEENLKYAIRQQKANAAEKAASYLGENFVYGGPDARRLEELKKRVDDGFPPNEAKRIWEAYLTSRTLRHERDKRASDAALNEQNFLKLEVERKLGADGKKLAKIIVTVANGAGAAGSRSERQGELLARAALPLAESLVGRALTKTESNTLTDLRKVATVVGLANAELHPSSVNSTLRSAQKVVRDVEKSSSSSSSSTSSSIDTKHRTNQDALRDLKSQFVVKTGQLLTATQRAKFNNPDADVPAHLFNLADVLLAIQYEQSPDTRMSLLEPTEDLDTRVIEAVNAAITLYNTLPERWTNEQLSAVDAQRKADWKRLFGFPDDDRRGGGGGIRRPSYPRRNARNY